MSVVNGYGQSQWASNVPQTGSAPSIPLTKREQKIQKLMNLAYRPGTLAEGETAKQLIRDILAKD